MSENQPQTVSPNEESFLDLYDSSEATGKAHSGLNTKIPEKDQPLICKFVLDPRWAIDHRKRGYIAVDEYRHRVGTGENDFRSHPDLVMLGLAPSSPEKEAYRAARDIMRELEKSGKKGTPEYVKAEAQAKLFEPALKGWFLIVKPNGNVIEGQRMPKDVVNKLWGKKETPWTKEVPSLIDMMKKEGRDPYNVRSESGWVMIYKEGQGLGTRYTVKEWDEERNETINGQKVKVTVPLTAKTNLAGLTLDKIPNPLDMAKRNAFTLEEAQAFVKSGGSVVPARALLQTNPNTGDAGSPQAGGAPAPGPAPIANLDDLPF